VNVVRLESWALVVTPAVAVLLVALGLHLGAAPKLFGARLYATSPGAGRSGFELQIVPVVEDGALTDAVPGAPLRLVTSAGSGRAEWQGVSNVDGVAQAWVDLPGVRARDVVRASVTEGERLLAEGTFHIPEPPPPSPFHQEAAAAATHRAGALDVALYLPGGKLVPERQEVVLARVTDAADGHGVDGASLSVEPEVGVAVERPFAGTVGGGWSEARVDVVGLLAAWTVSARAGDRSGSWYGNLPVSVGSAIVELPAVIPAGEPRRADVLVPPSTRSLYVAVDDASGRDFATGLEIAGGKASVGIPALAPGVYWVVTSTEPRPTEAHPGALLVRPLRVGDAASLGAAPPRASLLQVPAPVVSPILVLDGMALQHRIAEAIRRRGLSVAGGALGLAMLVEAWLILRGAARTRRRMAAVAEATEDAGDGFDAPRGSLAVVVMLLALTLLGFALLAGLLVVRPAP
jgi:hypothetical protein